MNRDKTTGQGPGDRELGPCRRCRGGMERFKTQLLALCGSRHITESFVSEGSGVIPSYSFHECFVKTIYQNNPEACIQCSLEMSQLVMKMFLLLAP